MWGSPRGGSSPLFGINQNKDLATCGLPHRAQGVGAFCLPIAPKLHHQCTMERVITSTRIHDLCWFCRALCRAFVESPRLTLEVDHSRCSQGKRPARDLLCSGSQLSRELCGNLGHLTCCSVPSRSTVAGGLTTKEPVKTCALPFGTCTVGLSSAMADHPSLKMRAVLCNDCGYDGFCFLLWCSCRPAAVGVSVRNQKRVLWNGIPHPMVGVVNNR